jgi:hypothetical protein
MGFTGLMQVNSLVATAQSANNVINFIFGAGVGYIRVAREGSEVARFIRERVFAKIKVEHGSCLT